MPFTIRNSPPCKHMHASLLCTLKRRSCLHYPFCCPVLLLISIQCLSVYRNLQQKRLSTFCSCRPKKAIGSHAKTAASCFPMGFILLTTRNIAKHSCCLCYNTSPSCCHTRETVIRPRGDHVALNQRLHRQKRNRSN